MSIESSGNAKDIFLAAIEIESVDDREAFLRDACSGDPSLRHRVDALILAHEKPESLLDRPAPKMEEGADGHDVTVDLSDDERLGTQIGPYKIREQIGDGGMGVVYVAEQEKPLRRKVALKVIKPGMDSKAVLARFDAERNALALMNHPNIAKVLDAGTTEKGGPFFVMELIQGQPITEYCDNKKLTIVQRLELFTQVCNAVQHAHQKGVIHRDIKPTNILVTEIDGNPVSKVIDFGIAKALGANLTDRTVYTSFQSLIGTPLYMSPEQTQLSGVDVGTSSDIYSLGILLYELLTGTTPLSPEELKQAAQDEVLRRIRETEAPRPSNRISSLGETTSQISQCRGTQPEQLGRIVRGDLDWIVMKALEKDRNRRYRTADAFANDIGRHLDNEPVEARPPSTVYRMRKFVKRNRHLVMGATAFTMLLLVAATVASLGWLSSMRQTQIAIDAKEQAAKNHQQLLEKTTSLRQVVQERALSLALQGELERALREVEFARELQASRRWTQLVEGIAHLYAGDPNEALEVLTAALGEFPESVAIKIARHNALFAVGKTDSWIAEWAEISSLPISDDEVEAYLLKAHAIHGYYPEEAVRLIEHYIKQRGLTGYSASVRAMARLRKAMFDGNLEAIEAAERDALVGVELMGESGRALQTAIGVHWWGLLLARQQGNKVEEAHHERSGLKMVNRLERHRDDQHLAFDSAAIFLELVGRTDDAKAYWEQAKSSPSFWLVEYSRFLLRQGRIDEVKPLLKGDRGEQVQRFLLAVWEFDCDDQDELMQEYMSDKDSIAIMRLLAWSVVRTKLSNEHTKRILQSLEREKEVQVEPLFRYMLSLAKEDAGKLNYTVERFSQGLGDPKRNGFSEIMRGLHFLHVGNQNRDRGKALEVLKRVRDDASCQATAASEIAHFLTFVIERNPSWPTSRVDAIR